MLVTGRSMCWASVSMLRSCSPRRTEALRGGIKIKSSDWRDKLLATYKSFRIQWAAKKSKRKWNSESLGPFIKTNLSARDALRWSIRRTWMRHRRACSCSRLKPSTAIWMKVRDTKRMWSKETETRADDSWCLPSCGQREKEIKLR